MTEFSRQSLDTEPKSPREVALEVRAAAQQLCPEAPDMAEIRQEDIVGTKDAELRRKSIPAYSLLTMNEVERVQDKAKQPWAQLGRILLMASLYCELHDQEGWEDEMNSAYDYLEALAQPGSPDQARAVELLDKLDAWNTNLAG